jgi:hypothetical protein
MTTYHREQIENAFNNAFNDWRPDEVMMTFYCARKRFNLYNKEVTQANMKIWRKLAKDGKIKIMEYNNKTKLINGVEHYIFVVQPYENEKMTDCNFDPMGLMVLGEMVSGFVYLFKKKENRNAIYNYVMKNISQPVGGTNWFGTEESGDTDDEP